MTISSFGYAGTVTDVQWPLLAGVAAGSSYTVENQNSWKVTAAAGTRVVEVAAGGGAGWGIYDDSSVDETLPSLSSVPSGSRWDMVVAHRNWDDKETTFTVIQGGSSRALPARDTNPGVEDDQPLALVRVAAGSTAIQEIVDLRVWARDGGVTAADPLALGYMNRIGTQIRIGTSLWCRELDVTGSPRWVDVFEYPTWTTITHITDRRNAANQYPFAFTQVPGGAVLRGGVARESAGGMVSGSQLALLPAGARPTSDVIVRDIRQTNVTGQAAKVSVGSDGRLYMDEVIVSSSGANPAWVSFDGMFIPRSF